MASPLLLNDIVKTYPDRVVLPGITASVPPGARVGLIGENGSGKSTLLRIAAGADDDFAGSVQRPADLGFLAQDTGLPPDARVGEVLHEALAPLHRGVAELQAAAEGLSGKDPVTAAAYDEALAWVRSHDAWDADRRATLAAARLGLAAIDPGRAVGSLSGGQRTRLALAALLTRRPDALLLDEPTNHLDDKGLAFLQSQLREAAGAVLVASHDRVFLDAVCTSTLDLDPSHFGTDGEGGRMHAGDYTAYRSLQRAARIRWQERYEAQQEELRGLRQAARTVEADVAHDRGPRDGDKFIYGFKGARVQATVSRRRQQAERRIESLERERIPKPPLPIRFAGRFDTTTAGRVRLRDVTVRGRLHIARLDVDPGGKLLVSGRNGAGKSTLLAVLAGTIPADQGVVDVHAARIGLLAQDVSLPDPDLTPLQMYETQEPSIPLRDLGLLHPRLLNVPLLTLSIGQVRRVELAGLIATQPDLLLLDEPTNHLSLQLVDDLESALQDTPATVVLASHDRWLRARWTGRVTHLP
ncbi:ABC-F family ATP-binding cassette domain-containing protein [Allobranchiibius huperziae]|uniref:Macrolide transport system ATP-binding/permease protein n=1 Tax=Allobranchiibius huperziae TaxID=1874116 RepID=A0A853DN05_9MICO|nr:ABC-F family ATP-binding cassette domain-containing protein [Allobranchiibius huperziae]NYJ76141.1 macrolide transport system ATP-binding/permease protein [Allobranchiibius huperziae]